MYGRHGGQFQVLPDQRYRVPGVVILLLDGTILWVSRTPAIPLTQASPRALASPSLWDVEFARSAAAAHLGFSETRWKHVAGVGELAEAWHAAGRIRAEVAVAAWVHDIGYGPLVRDTGFAPLDGARFLDSVQAPGPVVSLVAHHCEAMTEARERGLVEDLAAFPAPNAEDLDVLTLLVLSVGPQGQRTTPPERIADVLRLYESDSLMRRAVERSREQLLVSTARAAARLGV